MGRRGGYVEYVFKVNIGEVKIELWIWVNLCCLMRFFGVFEIEVKMCIYGDKRR